MGHIRCPRDFRLWLKVKPKPKPTWNVVDDVVHGLFDALDGGIKQSLHGVEWETDHALRRPANVLVVELVDRRLYLTALSTTSHAPTQSIDQRVPKVCRYNTHTHTHRHTHTFNGPLSGTTRVRRYQKGKINLDFTEARDSEWQWNPLGHTQVCISLQTDNHASTPPLSCSLKIILLCYLL